MNLHSFVDGLVLGLIAMTGVFLILAVIGLILFVFELIFYKKEKQNIGTTEEISREIISEVGIPKKVVAAITAAIYQHLNRNRSNVNETDLRIKIKKHKKINKTYEKLKLERWRNG